MDAILPCNSLAFLALRVTTPPQVLPIGFVLRLARHSTAQPHFALVPTTIGGIQDIPYLQSSAPLVPVGDHEHPIPQSPRTILYGISFLSTTYRCKDNGFALALAIADTDILTPFLGFRRSVSLSTSTTISFGGICSISVFVRAS